MRDNYAAGRLAFHFVYYQSLYFHPCLCFLYASRPSTRLSSRSCILRRIIEERLTFPPRLSYFLPVQIFYEACFKIVDPQAEKEDGDVLRFGQEISLVDDRGMVWNNKDGRFHGRLGPSIFGERGPNLFCLQISRQSLFFALLNISCPDFLSARTLPTFGEGEGPIYQFLLY